MKSTVLTLFLLPMILGITIEPKVEPIFEQNPVVLELFTSQGCSSCPPADELLKQVKSNNVITLSYHVDYWNYIGWKDPFSSKQFTEKQRKYSSKFYSSTIYTPQLVVNGQEHFVGSDKSKLKEKITKYSKFKTETTIDVSDILKNNDVINFNYKIKNLKPNESLRVVLVIDERVTSVKRGENRNRTLINSNIVVVEQTFKIKKPVGKGTIQIPKLVKPEDDLSLVLILENANLNITTATQKGL